jgi:hypothetical protein
VLQRDKIINIVNLIREHSRSYMNVMAMLYEEIKSTLNSMTSRYLRQNPLSSPLLSKLIKFKRENYNFASCLMWDKTWSLIQKKKHTLKVF